jgi:hypothetical protein
MDDFSAGCCSAACGNCLAPAVSRRGFFTAGLAGLALPELAAQTGPRKDPARQSPIRLPLRVQPVFIFQVKQPREAASWRWSAEIYTEAAAAEEGERIRIDLAGMAAQAGFPLVVLPLLTVQTAAEASKLAAGGNYDALVMYAAGRQPDVMAALARPDRWNLVFVRHRSGPIYYMYIGVHGHFFRKGRDNFSQPGMDVDDVVVDSHADLLWRLRALYGLKNTRGKRIACIGNAGGWGAEGSLAPQRARDVWNFDLVSVPYSDLEARLNRARNDAALVARGRDAASRYLKDGVTLETAPDFVHNAFLLTEIFRDILDETRTDAITVNNCMQTIMPMSRTTACLPLSVLNDEGYLAFCESDFVSIPAGVLLRYIAETPVFLCNASFPYKGLVTVSHCTAPRRMDGRQREAARILTHYESDYGAAPKVEMRKGQAVTVLDPDFGARRWLGFSGRITDTPFFPVCRSQLEIAVDGDATALRRELRGWHWIVSYGSYVRETGYALNKAGVGWLAV